MSGSVVLIGGGVRSGKSRFALRRASELGEERVYVATAEAHDDEMGERVRAHRAERGPEWQTREVPLELAAELRSFREGTVVVVDCLTLWLSNVLLAGQDVTARVADLCAAVRACQAHCVLVTNEVGLGIVPENDLARRFRDESGRLHQAVARHSDEVWFAALGVLLRLAPSPVEVVR